MTRNNLSTSNWDEMQQTKYQATDESILLSQNGIGDYNLRADSIKTLNSLRFSATLDLQALFHGELPETVEGYTEVRDTAETPRLAWYSNPGLLVQSISELFGTFGVTQEVSVLGYGGYEAWSSGYSAFPVNSQDIVWGTGFDLFLDRFIPKMVLSLRQKYLVHQDLNYSVRNFSGWSILIGTTVRYPP